MAMEEEKKKGLDIVKIAGVITAIATLLAVLFGQGFLAKYLPSSTTPTSVSENAPVWTIDFEMTVLGWNAGHHKYTFDIKCPEPEGSDTFGAEFDVSDSAPLLDQIVYLRLTGPNTGLFPAGEKLTTINPKQKTKFVVAFQGSYTKADVIELGQKCKITVAVDCFPPTNLKPSEPFPMP